MSGKSSLAQECYISYPIQFCQNNTTQFKYHAEYFNLEIKDVDVIAKLRANWIFKESKGKVKLSVNKIFQKGNNFGKLTTEQRDWITKSETYSDFLYEHCNFIAGENITNKFVFKRLMECAKRFGTMDKTKEGMEILHTYKPHDPNQFVTFIFDNVNNLNDKKLIDELSGIFVKFRNACGFTFVIVQQYNRSLESMDRRDFMEPQLADLKESGRTADDCDTAFLTFVPARYGLDDYEGFRLNEGHNGSEHSLGDFFRMIKIAKNRDGKDNIYLPYGFSGAVGFVKEMPTSGKWNLNTNGVKDEYYKLFE